MNELRDVYNCFSREDLSSERINQIKQYTKWIVDDAEFNLLTNGKLYSFMQCDKNTGLIEYPRICNDNGLCDVDSFFMIPRMDLVLTTKCTLKCEKCANLMQYYDKAEDIKESIIKKSMDKLLEAIDFLGELYVLGGEPFLYKNLGEIIEYLADNDKIGIIKIVTNGTICPDYISWDSLRHRKVVVTVSDYGALSKNKYALISKMRKEKINYYLMKIRFFYDTGNMIKRGRSPKELHETFINCSTLCRSLLDGKLYICPRAAHGMDLGLIPDSDSDYVDVITENNLRSKLIAFLNNLDFLACDYCDIRTENYYNTKSKPAVQLRGKL